MVPQAAEAGCICPLSTVDVQLTRVLSRPGRIGQVQ